MKANNSLATGTILKGASYTYRIEKTLGQGSFGITYLASVKMSGALGAIDANIRVAIKEFFMRDINGRSDTTVTSGSDGGIYDDYRKKFTREALNLSKLQHPNIIKVIESFTANNTIYYVMEYIGGGSLDDYIKRSNGLQEAEALRIIKQIGSALSFMHHQGMLHLDLKPSNIMMKESGDVVLIDFGLSKQYDDNGDPESSTKVGAGTPGYAPIEQANYREGNGFPVTMDVYALGATMYKMLTGERPPEASDILNDGFPLYSLQEHQVSERTIASIAKAMAPTRKDRYKTVEQFMKSFDREEEATVVEVETDKKELPERKEPVKPTVKKDTEHVAPPKEGMHLNGAMKKWIIGGACAAALLVGLILLVPKKTKEAPTTAIENVENLKTVLLPDTVKDKSFTNDVLGDYLYTGPVNKEGQPNGIGEAKFVLKGKPSGQTYKGPFKNGILTGDREAVFTFANGDTFVGTFKNDYFEKGKYSVSASGEYFIGTFSNGDPTTGTWYNKSGTKIQDVK